MPPRPPLRDLRQDRPDRRPRPRRQPDVCVNCCYTAALRRRGTCTGCGQQRRLVSWPGPGAGTCADCAGLIVTHACALCGIEDKLFQKGRCARCSLRHRTAALIRDPAGPGTPGPSIALDGVAGAFAATRTPYWALNWLRTGAAAAILADVAAAAQPSPTRRWMTTRTSGPPTTCGTCWSPAGVRPARDEALARMEQWSRNIRH